MFQRRRDISKQQSEITRGKHHLKDDNSNVEIELLKKPITVGASPILISGNQNQHTTLNLKMGIL